MIAIDTNLLVYSHRLDMEWHDKAFAVIRRCAEGETSWAIPWPCIHEFYAIVTNPRIFREPTPAELAVRQIAVWMASPTLTLLAENQGYWDFLQRLLNSGLIRGGQVHDTRIAALCLLHNITELWTADRDFQRFPLLKTRNPLLAPL